MLQLRIRADKTGDGPPWPLASVELVGDAPRDHNFADSFVTKGLAGQYLSFTNPRPVASVLPADVSPYERDPVITGDEIVLHLASGELRYKVLEHPGKHADESEHSGWRVSHEYRCRLIRTKSESDS